MQPHKFAFVQLIACVSIMSLTAGPVLGATVVVDPDAFSDGTDISNSFAGTTLTQLGGSTASVFALANGFASTGANVFGTARPTFPEEWGDGFNNGMRADFTLPTNFVSIDIIGNDSSGDIGRLLAFDTSDQLLDTYTTANIGLGVVETASIARASFDISYVIATGSADGVEAVSLDNLQYMPIPLPAAAWMALPVLGAAGLVRVLRHRRPM